MQRKQHVQLSATKYSWDCPDDECGELNITEDSELWGDAELNDVKCDKCGKEFFPELD